MWRPTVFSLAIVLLAISGGQVAEGLECYSCWDEASEPANIVNGRLFYHVEGHKSCGRGQIPDDKFKVTCSPVGDDIGKDDTPICAQLFVEARNASGTVQLTARSCVYTNRTIEDLINIKHSCGTRTLDSLIKLTLGDINEAIWEVSDDFPTDTAQVCHCNSDNCNGSMGISGGHVVNLLLVAFVALIHTTFFRG